EKHAVYGGSANLKQGLDNVSAKYRPRLIGIATTCLTETIGDDVRMILHEYRRDYQGEGELPVLVPVSTPSYSGTHMEGFHAAVYALVEALAEGGPRHEAVNILPGLVSPADLRHLKGTLVAFGINGTILPDISDTLDGPALADCPLIPEGGTTIEEIKAMGRAKASIEFGLTLPEDTGGVYLEKKCRVANHRLPMPIGIRATDRFLNRLAELTGREIPMELQKSRGRLIDALVDGHKYLAAKTAVLYGEEDLVVGLAGFLAEIGVRPLLCASGGQSGRFQSAIAEILAGLPGKNPEVFEGMDFYEIAERAEALKPDLIIGHSKGYGLARKLGIPLIRVGFPIHDRLGGQRILHLGYEGAQQLFDLLANELIRVKQDNSPVGYSYM
ncbi:MAG TPA: nitrogenase component 1, partial [Desulfurivibrionaceae bacterium]|nr:nitrogenase component 1 [Desulfurivibrionaceae bacterium]